jgi:hypothetical protein
MMNNRFFQREISPIQSKKPHRYLAATLVTVFVMLLTSCDDSADNAEVSARESAEQMVKRTKSLTSSQTAALPTPDEDSGNRCRMSTSADWILDTTPSFFSPALNPRYSGGMNIYRQMAADIHSLPESLSQSRQKYYYRSRNPENGLRVIWGDDRTFLRTRRPGGPGMLSNISDTELSTISTQRVGSPALGNPNTYSREHRLIRDFEKAGTEIWYANTQYGLRQGIKLKYLPSDSRTVTFEIKLGGDFIEAEKQSDGTIDIQTKRGDTVIYHFGRIFDVNRSPVSAKVTAPTSNLIRVEAQLTEQTEPPVHLYGRFSPVHEGPSISYDLLVGQLTGDKRADVMHQPDGSIYRHNIYRGTSDAALVSPKLQGQQADISGTSEPHLIDIDGDRRDEIASIDMVTRNVGIWKRDDIFEKKQTFDIYPDDLTAGDFDGDGDQDLAAISSGERVYLFENTGNQLRQAEATSAKMPELSIAETTRADVDGDGADEIVIGSSGGRLLIIGRTENNRYETVKTVETHPIEDLELLRRGSSMNLALQTTQGLELYDGNGRRLMAEIKDNGLRDITTFGEKLALLTADNLRVVEREKDRWRRIQQLEVIDASAVTFADLDADGNRELVVEDRRFESPLRVYDSEDGRYQASNFSTQPNPGEKTNRITADVMGCDGDAETIRRSKTNIVIEGNDGNFRQRLNVEGVIYAGDIIEDKPGSELIVARPDGPSLIWASECSRCLKPVDVAKMRKTPFNAPVESLHGLREVEGTQHLEVLANGAWGQMTNRWIIYSHSVCGITPFSACPGGDFDVTNEPFPCGGSNPDACMRITLNSSPSGSSAYVETGCWDSGTQLDVEDPAMQGDYNFSVYCNCISGSCPGAGSLCPGPGDSEFATETITVDECCFDSDCGFSEVCCSGTCKECCGECCDDSDCSGSQPICDTGSNTCVECTSDGDCSCGNECTSNTCSTGCNDNSDCCGGEVCDGGSCVTACSGDPDSCFSVNTDCCTSDAECGSCGECNGCSCDYPDGNCPTCEYCDSGTESCEPVTDGTSCGSCKECQSGSCNSVSRGSDPNGDCSMGTDGCHVCNGGGDCFFDDGQCSGSETCELGNCESSSECSTNTDCDDLDPDDTGEKHCYICEAGNCVAGNEGDRCVWGDSGGDNCYHCDSGDCVHTDPGPYCGSTCKFNGNCG